MIAMVQVLLLYDVLRLEERMLLERLEERGVRVRVLHTRTTVIPLAWEGEPPSTVDGDVALDRCISFYNAVTAAHALESWGVRVVNSGYAIAVTGDKVWTLSLLRRHGVPVPRTLLAYTVDSAVKAAGMLGYPVVLKPVVGSWGRFLALAGDEEAVRAIAEHREYMGGPYRVHYLQEYIRKPGRDIRAMCVGDSVPAAIYRVSSHWITNTARGGRAEPLRVEGELEDIVLRACRAVGADVAGVDVVEDPERGYLVLEVNGVPEFKNLAAVTGVDVAGLIADHVVALAKR